MEDRQLDDGDDLKRLLGFTAPIAVRLLELRQVVRTAPETSAITAATLDPLMVRVLAAKFHLAESSITVKMFWTLVAQLGGVSVGTPMARLVGERSGRAGVILLTGLMVFAFSPPKKVGKDQRFRGNDGKRGTHASCPRSLSQMLPTGSGHPKVKFWDGL